MIKINKYHIKRLDASNITIHEEYEGVDKDGNSKTQYRFCGYYGTLADALIKVWDLCCMESVEHADDLKSAVDFMEQSKAEIINALGKCQDFHEFE